MQATYLDRFLQPVTSAMSREFAEQLVSLRADEELQREIESLRRAANEGTISPEEDAKYREIVEAIDFISILQAKARSALQHLAG